MAVRLERVTPGTRDVVERLWQLYVHDLSEFRGTSPDPDGRFPAGRLPQYVDALDDPDRRSYLLHDDDGLAGFALVRGLVQEPRVLSEFFVVRSARRKRVGHHAALQLLRQHPGPWQIAFQEGNPAAARFWRRVATEAVGAGWSEQRRAVPGKPDLPPDTWLVLTT